MNSRQDRQAHISVDEPFTNSIQKDILCEIPGSSVEGWLTRITREAMDVALQRNTPAQMSLLITGDETVHNLNIKFRGLDEVTDVLSFSADHGGRWEGESDPPEESDTLDFIMPPGELAPLGEVIVSYPQAQRQAEEQGVPLEYELALLVVHGVLHLTGHDHLEREEAELMQSREQAALAKLNIHA